MKKNKKLFHEEYLINHSGLSNSGEGIHYYAYFDSVFLPRFQTINSSSPYAMYALILDGSYQTCPDADNTTFESCKGEFIISRFRNTSVNVKVTSKNPCRRKCLLMFQTELHNAIVSHYFPELRTKIILSDINRVEKIFDMIKLEFERNTDKLDEPRLAGLFLELMQTVNSQAEKKNAPEAFAKALRYITLNLHNKKLCRKDIAEASGVSIRTLTRLFHDKLKVQVMQYVINLRLERVKGMLYLPNIRINEIAEKCGFGSSSYMTRMFRKCYNLTPREYYQKGIRKK